MSRDFRDVTTDKLAAELEGIDDELVTLNADRKEIAAELVNRLRPEINQELERARKDHGKVTVRAVGGREFDVEVRQTVKWDSEVLVSICKSGLVDAGEQARVFEMELHVPERVYNNLPDGEFKQAITKARTTKLSEPSLKLKRGA